MPALLHAAANRAKQSYLVIEIFVGASLLPTPDRMGEVLRSTIGLDPGPVMARPPPACRRLRCFPFIPSCQFSNKKTPPPCTDNGSHLRGARLTGDYKDQKNHPKATHIAAEKPLTGSTSNGPTVTTTTAKSVSAASGATAQQLKCCNLAGRDEA